MATTNDTLKEILLRVETKLDNLGRVGALEQRLDTLTKEVDKINEIVQNTSK